MLLSFNIVMVFFIMSCTTHNSDGYAKLYIAEIKFNSTNEISTMLNSQYMQQHDSNRLLDFSMRIGFQGVCLNFGGEKDSIYGSNCGYTSDMNDLYGSKVPSFSVTSNQNSTSGAELDMFDITHKIQGKATKYRIYIVEIVVLLVLLLFQVYNILGFLPGQEYALLAIIALILIFFTIHCISITWLLVTMQNLQTLGSVMTMNILAFFQGKRIQGVIWSVFGLILLQMGFYAWLLITGAVAGGANTINAPTRRKDVEKDYRGYNHSVMSSISTLRDTL
ncbi:hypothetical protein CANINC_004410 [Pichia inconspicua]|uniref:TRP C-terminal domain-containing protein n=1 Tax=Pichia inconspicua TaxID=52247 RepID=A0A4T0WWF0_9ASCO|nr:hypothetical protein CANINC_004410 [[Candida] inconspicua]